MTKKLISSTIIAILLAFSSTSYAHHRDHHPRADKHKSSVYKNKSHRASHKKKYRSHYAKKHRTYKKRLKHYQNYRYSHHHRDYYGTYYGYYDRYGNYVAYDYGYYDDYGVYRAHYHSTRCGHRELPILGALAAGIVISAILND